MTISTEEGIKELIKMGLTPKAIPDPDDPNTSHFFIENTVDWSTFFYSLEKSIKEEIESGAKETKLFYDSIKHKKWLKKLIIAHNPTLDWVEVQGKMALAIVYPKMQERGDKVPRLNENFNKWFFFATIFLRDLLGRFEL